MLVYGFIHPIFALLVTAVIEVAVVLNKVDILINHVPHFLYACAVEAAVAEHLGLPAAV